jgi:hypothetical protein
MPVAKWLDADLHRFLAGLMDELRSCSKHGCDEEPEYTFADGFAHTFLYCRPHAKEMLNSGMTNIRDMNRWRKIRECH